MARPSRLTSTTHRPSATASGAVAKPRTSPTPHPVEGGRDRRTAYVPLKHDSEKITEEWARRGRKTAPETGTVAKKPSLGKVVDALDPNATRSSLYKIAKRLAIKNRSSMTKKQLIEAIRNAAAPANRAE